MKVQPIKPQIGAIVELGRAELDDREVIARCRALLEEHVVLVFPRIGLSDEEQLALTDSMGARLNFFSNVEMGTVGTPDVYTITLNPEKNRQQEYIAGTYFWHTDGMTVPQRPPRAGLLTARSVANDGGGDTHFANTYAAYESLSDRQKAEINDLRVMHNLEPYLSSIVEKPTDEELARWRASPVNEHPLVRTNATGRKSLVLGYTAHHIAGMELAAGKALLARLLEWAARPEFTYEHQWQEGDLVIWDNYGSLHRVTPYGVESGREMHRTSIAA